MSEIDSYQHRLLGFVRCPAKYEIVPYRTEVQEVPIYEILEHAKCDSFDAKAGDILVGGGSGESAALRIAMPEAIRWYTASEYQDLRIDQIQKAYWTPDQSFVFGTGYEKLGWNPRECSMETWLTEHVLAFLTRQFPKYQSLLGLDALTQDGLICQ